MMGYAALHPSYALFVVGRMTRFNFVIRPMRAVLIRSVLSRPEIIFQIAVPLITKASCLFVNHCLKKTLVSTF